MDDEDRDFRRSKRLGDGGAPKRVVSTVTSSTGLGRKRRIDAPQEISQSSVRYVTRKINVTIDCVFLYPLENNCCCCFLGAVLSTVVALLSVLPQVLQKGQSEKGWE